MKPETRFRVNTVTPFLKSLKNTSYFPIQQLAIRGDPDFILCIWGRFVALELKKDAAEDARSLQQYKLQKVQKTNGISFVASPENWEEVSKKLSEMDASKEIAWKSKSNQNLKLKSPTKT